MTATAVDGRAMVHLTHYRVAKKKAGERPPSLTENNYALLTSASLGVLGGLYRFFLPAAARERSCFTLRSTTRLIRAYGMG